MVKTLLVLVFWALFLTAAPLVAAPPDPVSVAEWKKAETYLINKRPQEAYELFTVLLGRYPGHSSLMLGLARSSALTGHFQEALEIYRQLLAKFPGDPILLNERDQVQGLLAGTGSPTTVNFRMRAGVLYDSNANQGAPDDLVLSIFGLSIPLEGTKRISTMGGYFGANFNISHRLSEISPWSLVGDSGLYIRGNEDSDLNDIKSSEWQWFRVGGGLRYAKGQNLFEFRIKGEFFDYELTNRVISWGPELIYLRAVTPKFHLISQFSLDYRDYQRSPERDGDYGQIYQNARFFFGDNTNSLTFGVGYLWGRPKLDNLEYYGFSIPLRLTLRLTEDWELSPHLNYIHEKYRGKGIIFDLEDRRDKKIRSGLDVIYKINDRLRVEFNYSFNRSDSNSAFYDYAQHSMSLGLSWGF
ncbi:MAG: surface lipoprotein assembly modifier [Deltaproteobacteria bacterium]|jgi:tetratricopeptide (TPR) repeat protein|nr:surface lipoprotein assembly modifier [Deltaproteobacteria bacterium]